MLHFPEENCSTGMVFNSFSESKQWTQWAASWTLSTPQDLRKNLLLLDVKAVLLDFSTQKSLINAFKQINTMSVTVFHFKAIWVMQLYHLCQLQIIDNTQSHAALLFSSWLVEEYLSPCISRISGVIKHAIYSHSWGMEQVTAICSSDI